MPATRTNPKRSGRAVPNEFQPLLALARTWAIADEAERYEYLEGCSLEAKRTLVQVAFPHLDALENWIATQDPFGPIGREIGALRLVSQAATEAMIDVYADE